MQVRVTSALGTPLGQLGGRERLGGCGTPDAVLVASKANSQDVKHIVSQLTIQKRKEYTPLRASCDIDYLC
jgi:hypothetical protein